MKNDEALTSLLSAQNFLASIPAGAPGAVRLYAESRVKALSGKKGRRKPTKAAKASPAPAPAISPAPPTRATIAPAPVDALALARAKELVARNDRLVKEALRSELVERLRSVRTALAVKRPQLQALVGQVRQRDATGEALDSNIAWRRERIALLQHERNPVFDFLPGDPEAIAWQTEVSKLESEIAAIQATATALPNPYQLKLEAVNLQNDVQCLLYAETASVNQLRNLEGRPFAAWGGREVVGGIHTPF